MRCASALIVATTGRAAAFIFPRSAPTAFTFRLLPRSTSVPLRAADLSRSVASVENGVVRAPAPPKPPSADPLSWDEIVHNVRVKRDLSLFARSASVDRSYRAHTARVRDEWASVGDYILCHKFQVGRRRREDDGRWEAHPRASSGAAATTCLVPNDFPYHVCDGIGHDVLWKIGGAVSEEDVEHAARTVAEGGADDVLTLINPAHLRSVPDIDHAHILSRRRH